MQCTNMLDIKHQLNPGVQVGLLLVFHGYEVVAPTDQVKVLLEICVEEEECLHQLKLGEDGTDQSTRINVDMQYVLL